MKIGSSNIGMESARSYKASSTTARRFLIKEYQAGLMQNQNFGNAAPEDEKTHTAGNIGSKNAVGNGKSESAEGTNTGSVSAAYKEWQDKYQSSVERSAVSHVTARSDSSNTYAYIRENSILYIFELLFGSIRDRFGWTNFANDSTCITSTTGSAPTESASEGNVVTANMKMLVYSGEESHWESEETSFSTTGCVRTQDGREISFNIDVGMSREFQSYYREEMVLQSFQLCDPLVINLDTDVAQLSDQKFYFDIDADGEEDEISMLGKGSGYLALDKNGDGIINDGSELFGTNSGDGFADLSQYDEDGNGWIDENDSIWSKLKIWCKDENGEDILYGLSEKGVGAICLQRASTDFALKDDANRTQGVIRNTGVFLYENGAAGTIQHVDVAKYNKKA